MYLTAVMLLTNDPQHPTSFQQQLGAYPNVTRLHTDNVWAWLIGTPNIDDENHTASRVEQSLRPLIQDDATATLLVNTYVCADHSFMTHILTTSNTIGVAAQIDSMLHGNNLILINHRMVHRNLSDVFAQLHTTEHEHQEDRDGYVRTIKAILTGWKLSEPHRVEGWRWYMETSNPQDTILPWRVMLALPHETLFDDEGESYVSTGDSLDRKRIGVTDIHIHDLGPIHVYEYDCVDQGTAEDLRTELTQIVHEMDDDTHSICQVIGTEIVPGIARRILTAMTIKDEFYEGLLEDTLESIHEHLNLKPINQHLMTGGMIQVLETHWKNGEEAHLSSSGFQIAFAAAQPESLYGRYFEWQSI